jgi:hypothetical protein
MDPLSLEAFDNHDNQPAMGATKVGEGWQESIGEATTRPQRLATTNNESVQQMVMTATKRARMARVMATAMRVPVNKEDKGGTGHDNGNEGGVRQRGRWQWRQKQRRRGWRGSDSNKGNGNREGKQQSTNNRINKGGRWLAREH